MKLEKIFSGDRDMVSDDTFGYSKRLASGECLNFPGRFGIAIKWGDFMCLHIYDSTPFNSENKKLQAV